MLVDLTTQEITRLIFECKKTREEFERYPESKGLEIACDELSHLTDKLEKCLNISTSIPKITK